MFSISSITNLICAICAQDIKTIILQLFSLVSVLAQVGIDAGDTAVYK